jgi:hypothetical protein
MNNPNFGSILDQPSEAIEKPKPLPVGTYICSVKGLPKMDVSAKKKTEFVEFQLQILGAHDDVDQEALAEALRGKALSEKTIRATYYLTEDAVWRLKDFLDHCGVEDGAGVSLRQRISATPGAQVNASIRHRPSEDGTTIYAELGSTAPAA